MTLQNLSKILDKYDQKLGHTETKQLELLKGLPFYNWQDPTDTKTFNHVIGLPRKWDQEKPLFDYEKLLYDSMQKHKHIFLLKATGLGATEFFIRYMAWLCLKDDSLSGSQMAIITGPRIDISIELVRRMKRLFSNKLDITFDTKETVVELNGVHIEAYPSHTVGAALRGLDRLVFILSDESDFYPVSQQNEMLTVVERYIGKSDPNIILCSTPNAPDQLFDRIEKDSSSLYHKIRLDYKYGLGKIYTEADIEQAKRSPSFLREYCLFYLGIEGNVFSLKDIEAAIEKGKKLNSSFNANSYAQCSVGLDPGFGSSAFGVCITSLEDGMINVLHAEEYPRPDFNQMINTTVRLLDEYNVTFEGRSRIFVDGANPSFIRSLKERVDEDINYDKVISYFKKTYPSVYSLEFLEQSMFIIPVQFSKYHKEMLAHTKEMMEYQHGQVAINPRHDKLITALRTAVENGEGVLDKDATSHDDLFDSFRLSLMFWH